MSTPSRPLPRRVPANRREQTGQRPAPTIPLGVVLNVLGMALLALGLAGLGWLAYDVDPRLGAAYGALGCAVGGYVLATREV